MNDLKMISELKDAFREVYGDAEGASFYFAPGRANLIGEHIDYNGGHVLPCALAMGTYAAVRKRSDRGLRFYSVNFRQDGVITGSLDDLRPLEDDTWAAYMKGVIWALERRGAAPDRGLDIVLYGDLPGGAGLSSSASVEVLTGWILKDLFDLPLSVTDIAVCGQEAERGYIGVDCGIMDQYACAAGREGYAMDLDTADLGCRYVPLSLPGIDLLITNTNIKHDLRSSAYNERRQQCAAALEILREHGSFASLCSVDPEEFTALEGIFDDPVLQKRARHAVMENDRVRQAAEALQKGQIETLGRLMNASHRSLKEDFEVSCCELDILAETAQMLPGVLGSRMMGGGFGGCTISLVRRDHLDAFKETLRRVYLEKTGITCTFYSVSPGGGPKKLG